jgi:ketosteroid isomerase-like protein
MSEEHADLLRRLIDAWNQHDVDALLALLSPDVVWEENAEFPGLREVYRGRAEVREWAEEILEPWESSHAQLAEITQLSDDRVLTEAVITGRGKGGGVPVELRFWLIVWFVAGKIKRREVFWVRDEALEAAGLAD